MSAVAAAVIGGVGAIGGALIGANGAQNAANTEASAAANAASTQAGMFNVEQQTEQPYVQAGTNALSQINQNMPMWNSGFQPTMAQLEQTPGYQFQLEQGLGAVQNQAAAQGHLVSSQELGNAAGFAEGLASTGYQQAFNNYQTQIQNSYNRLAGIAQLGQGAAANTGAAAVQTGANIANTQIGAGNAGAAAQVGTANAISGGIQGTANAIGQYNTMGMLAGLYQNQGVNQAQVASAPGPAMAGGPMDEGALMGQLAAA